MRTVPMFEVIAEAIRKHCPSSWVINYTNPMAICTNTLYQVFPGIKAFGCCHEVFGTQELLMKMLKEEHNVKDDVRIDDIRINVLGVNHFTWINRANWRSVDLMELMVPFADKYAVTGFKSDGWYKLRLDLFRRYHALAAAGDRHLAEFMPPWYLKDPETVASWGFGLTKVSDRKRSQKEQADKGVNYLSGEEKFVIKKSSEVGTDLIKALLGLSEKVTNVNLPNSGQMDDIERGVIVETNALFSRDSVRPLYAGKLPDLAHMLVSKQTQNQAMLIRACLDRNMELAYNVFLNDNLVRIDIADAAALFREMVLNTKEYLKDWDVEKGLKRIF